jgi:hypothetical protein
MGYLLEKDGKINEAFDLMMNRFSEKLLQVKICESIKCAACLCGKAEYALVLF